MLPGLSERVRRSVEPAVLVVGAVLLVVVAVLPFTGVIGVTAAGALLVLGLVAGLLALSARDGCAILTCVVVLLLVVPQPYVVVGPLKSVGNPAALVALGGLAIWAAIHVAGGIIMQVWCIAASFAGKIDPRHDAPLWNITLFWHFLLVTILVTGAVTAALPRML